jgi:NADH-quinone oxidoreductase subunit N
MSHDLLLLSPVLLVALAGLLFLALEVFRQGSERSYMGPLAALIYAGAALAVVGLWGASDLTLQNAYVARVLLLDHFGLLLSLFILGAAAVTSVLAVPYLAEHGVDRGEFHASIAFAAFGMLVMVLARELFTLFLGLEVMSLSVYLLVAFRRARSYLSVESALKYFILGSVASAIFLYAIAFVYGLTGATGLAEVALWLKANPESAQGVTARLVVLLLVVALGFKVAAVPFHFWTPDAYQGAPTPVTGFMATGVKVASFGVLVRIFLSLFQENSFYLSTANWMALLYGLSMASMLVGNLTAIVQKNVKRMLAWSSVAHAGYLLIGVVTVTSAGGLKAMSPGVLYYLLAYSVANLVAFGVLSLLSGEVDGQPTFDKLDGLARRHPLLALAFTLAMVSLAGIPPTGGFFGKYYIFRDAMQANSMLFLPLIITAVITSMVSVYYYLKPVVHLYMREPSESTAQPHQYLPAAGALAALCLLVLHLGVFPGGYVSASARAMGQACAPAIQAAYAAPAPAAGAGLAPAQDPAAKTPRPVLGTAKAPAGVNPLGPPPPRKPRPRIWPERPIKPGTSPAAAPGR